LNFSAAIHSYASNISPCKAFCDIMTFSYIKVYTFLF
jgi:hypothetical protein